ncbi:hypothetical protein IF1G_03484 [Cordyceps javanica]|uniref:Uncharacterized protein n=1 Tax=Cordyceps javanica TaxID=43265 RepID=A0A545V7Q0_9HYPO|nr:hypothetical protein IF1G_03484 [Cordyceps javanica]
MSQPPKGAVLPLRARCHRRISGCVCDGGFGSGLNVAADCATRSRVADLPAILGLWGVGKVVRLAGTWTRELGVGFVILSLFVSLFSSSFPIPFVLQLLPNVLIKKSATNHRQTSASHCLLPSLNGPSTMEQIETQASDLRFLSQAQVPLSNSPSVTYETPRTGPQQHGSPGSASFGGNSATHGDAAAASAGKRKSTDDGLGSAKQTRSKRNRVSFSSFDLKTVAAVTSPASPQPLTDVRARAKVRLFITVTADGDTPRRGARCMGGASGIGLSGTWPSAARLVF